MIFYKTIEDRNRAIVTLYFNEVTRNEIRQIFRMTDKELTPILEENFTPEKLAMLQDDNYCLRELSGIEVNKDRIYIDGYEIRRDKLKKHRKERQKQRGYEQILNQYEAESAKRIANCQHPPEKFTVVCMGTCKKQIGSEMNYDITPR